MRLEITAEEKKRCESIIYEGTRLAEEIRGLPGSGTLGFMIFMMALDTMRRKYTGMFERMATGKALPLLAQWIAAGEPEDSSTVPARLLARYGPEVFHEIENDYAEAEMKKNGSDGL